MSSSLPIPSASTSTTIHRCKDSSGNDLTFIGSQWNDQQKCREVIQKIEQYYEQVFKYGGVWDIILDGISPQSNVAEGNTENVTLLPHVLEVDFWLAKNNFPNAISALSRAEKVYSSVPSPESTWTTRERFYLESFQSMMKGDLTTAREKIGEKHQLLSFLLGDRRTMLTIMQRADVVRACSGTKPSYHSMLAFALEENDQMEPARNEALKALAMDKNEIWAQHVLAHVFFANGELQTGLDFLLLMSSQWTHCMSFMYTHNWFHVALIQLDLDRYEDVTNVFEKRLWPFAPKEEDGSAAPTVTASSATPAPAAASTSSDGSLSVATPTATGTTSFGLPLTTKSFPLNDPFYPEDQNGALNLLWRFEIRCELCPATARKEELVDVDSDSAGAEGTSWMPNKDWFNHQWNSVRSYLATPPQGLLTLFGLLQLYCAFRCGDLQRGREIEETIRKQVSEMPADGTSCSSTTTQKKKLEYVLLPLAQAIRVVFEDGENGWKTAHALLRPLMDPHYRAIAIAEFACKSAAGLHPSSAATASNASQSNATSASASAPPTTSSVGSDPPAAIDLLPVPSSPTPPLDQPPHLSCLSASGEQLEVLTEWWMLVCARAREYRALQRTIGQKEESRKLAVGWYGRLDSWAEDAFDEANPYSLHYEYHVDAWTEILGKMRVKDSHGMEYSIHTPYQLVKLEEEDVNLLLNPSVPIADPSFDSLRSRIDAILSSSDGVGVSRSSSASSSHSSSPAKKTKFCFFKLSSRSPKDVYPLYVDSSDEVLARCRESERIQEDLQLHRRQEGTSSGSSSETRSMYLCFSPFMSDTIQEYRCFISNGRFVCMSNIQDIRLNADAAYQLLPGLRNILSLICENPLLPQFRTCALDVWHFEGQSDRLYVMEPNELDPHLDCLGYTFEEIQPTG